MWAVLRDPGSELLREVSQRSPSPSLLGTRGTKILPKAMSQCSESREDPGVGRPVSGVISGRFLPVPQAGDHIPPAVSSFPTGTTGSQATEKMRLFHGLLPEQHSTARDLPNTTAPCGQWGLSKAVPSTNAYNTSGDLHTPNL